MTKLTRIVAILPARMASSRLPGKPLLQIEGLPMIEHVRRRALLCGAFAEVVVATCDEAIAQAVHGFGGACVMTSPSHPAATDRVSEAMRGLDCTHVVNVQGDEILVLPGDLGRLVDAMAAHPDIPAWNAVAPLERVEELSDACVVKCAVSSSGRILWCARNFSALAPRLTPGFEPLRRVIGILGYRRDFLERYGALSRTPLEVAEAIDQSRILEHDVWLQGVAFTRGYPGINDAAEAEAVRRLLREDPQQAAILRQVLRYNPARLEANPDGGSPRSVTPVAVTPAVIRGRAGGIGPRPSQPIPAGEGVSPVDGTGDQAEPGHGALRR